MFQSQAEWIARLENLSSQICPKCGTDLELIEKNQMHLCRHCSAELALGLQSVEARSFGWLIVMLIGLAVNLAFSGFLGFALIVDRGGPKSMIVPSIILALASLIALALLPRKLHVLRALSPGVRWLICGLVWMALPTLISVMVYFFGIR